MLRRHVGNLTMHHQNTLLHELGKAMPRWRFEQLASHANHAYHLGLGPIRRSTLAEAKAKRPLALYEAVFGQLLDRLQPRLAQRARAAPRLVDATMIRLSALSEWARVCLHHHAVKLHVAYDPKAAVPTFFEITKARVNDITVAKAMPIVAGATYVFDKGYYDFGFWAALDAAGCRFVTRRKVNTPLTVIEDRPATGPAILADQLGVLPARLARSRQNPYPKPIQLVTVARAEGPPLELLTNDLNAAAAVIAALCQARWQVELFLRWIKQNLKIKRFLGTSAHAIKLQILTALIAYLLLRLAQQALPQAGSLRHLARLVKVNLMHKKTLADLIHPPPGLTLIGSSAPAAPLVFERGPRISRGGAVGAHITLGSARARPARTCVSCRRAPSATLRVRSAVQDGQEGARRRHLGQLKRSGKVVAHAPAMAQGPPIPPYSPVSAPRERVYRTFRRRTRVAVDGSFRSSRQVGWWK